MNVGDVLYFTGLVEEFGEFCEEHGKNVGDVLYFTGLVEEFGDVL